MGNKLSLKRLKQVLHYNPKTGQWRWLITQGKAYAGSQAGAIQTVRNTYQRRKIGFDGVQYRSACLAWFYMTGRWPDFEIDHVDGNPLNDCWKNLRKATHIQNCQNTRPHRDSLTGLKGILVHRDSGPRESGNGRKPRLKRYQARIRVNGKNVSLGYYLTPEEAHAAYAKAAAKFFGEYARVV